MKESDGFHAQVCSLFDDVYCFLRSHAKMRVTLARLQNLLAAGLLNFFAAARGCMTAPPESGVLFQTFGELQGLCKDFTPERGCVDVASF